MPAFSQGSRRTLPIGMLVLLALLLPACRSISAFFESRRKPQQESAALGANAGEIAVRAVVTIGALRTMASSKALALQNIQSQLQYLVGALHETGATADLNSLEITLRDSHSEASGERVQTYAATMMLSWPATVQLPTEPWLVLVPRNVDSTPRRDFFTRYGEPCGAALAEGSSAASFWSAYRPNLPTCPLKGAEPDNATTERLAIVLEPEGSRALLAQLPPYAGLWSDGRIESVFVLPDQTAIRRLSVWLTSALGEAKTEEQKLVYKVASRGDLKVRLVTLAQARAWPASAWSGVEVAGVGSAGDVVAASQAAALLSGDAGWPDARLVLVSAHDRLAFASPGLRRTDLIAVASSDDASESSWRAAAGLVKALIESTESFGEMESTMKDSVGRSLRYRAYVSPVATNSGDL